MSTYERSNKAVGAGTTVQAIYKQAEISLYGSDRLGQYKPTDVSISTLYSSLNTNLQNNPTFGDSERITENANLITSKADNLVNTTPSFNITGITNFVARTAPLQANILLQNNIAGQTSDNVAIGETIQNEMELYSVVAKDYFGQPNVCLLYDKNNLLVANSGGIIADANSKNIITRHPSDPNKYWLFTRDALGKLYRTEIVFALNAANVRTADVPVATKNQLLTTNVGAHFTAVEDRKRNVLFLYTTRRAPSSNTSTPDAELITIKMTESATLAPAVMAKLPYPETDLYNGGELQISADGKQLLWYHLGQRAAFFDYQNLQPHTFLLEDGMVAVLGGENAGIPLIPAQIPNPLAGLPAQVPNPLRNEFTLRTSAYIEIDKLENENNIYFTQKNIVNVDKWYKNSILQLGVTNGGNFRRSKRTGEVYQAFDGLVSLGTGLPVQVHTITDVPLSAPTRTTASRLLRVRNYELKDHLGNVRVIVADQKQEDASAKIQSYSNYYAFGMEMPNRQYVDNQGVSYRYGYNGKEKENELNEQNYDFGARIYDSRIAKWLSTDPLQKKFPAYTPYSFVNNMPIWAIDPDGKDIIFLSGVPTQTKEKIMKDLQQLTGLKLEINKEGKLIYSKQDKYSGGSELARDMIIKVIDNQKVEYQIMGSQEESTHIYGGVEESRTIDNKPLNVTCYLLNVNPNEMEAYIAGTSKSLNKLTMGYGMSVLHEISHKANGLKDASFYGVIGTNEEFMNKIRTQMDLNTESEQCFGQRISYNPKVMYIEKQGKSFEYIPFSEKPAVYDGDFDKINTKKDLYILFATVHCFYGLW